MNGAWRRKCLWYRWVRAMRRMSKSDELMPYKSRLMLASSLASNCPLFCSQIQNSPMELVELPRKHCLGTA